MVLVIFKSDGAKLQILRREKKFVLLQDMSQRIFYRYNPSTDQFERVFPSKGERLRARMRQAAVSVLAGVAVVAVAYSLIDRKSVV